MKNLTAIGLAAIIFFAGCKKDEEVKPTCDSTVTPIVFVHGLLASGDTWANQFMRFTSNNYCSDRLFAYDYNSLNFYASQSPLDTAALDDFIDAVLQKTGATQINLVGHSLGGSYSYLYLEDPMHAAKVAHYAHVGSGKQTEAAGPNADVPTINIYSPDDMVTEGADIPGATNVSLAGKDHYEVATCSEAFAALYKFFNDNNAPATLDIEHQSQVKISGKVVSLGENEPKTNATVRVFRVDKNSGERLSSTPDFTLSLSSDGSFGPYEISSATYYEFEVDPNDTSDRIIHYYREPFIHDNPLVYLRTLPPPTGMAGLLVNSLPHDDAQSVTIIFTASQAVIHSRDQLSFDGNQLSTTEFCSPEDNTIAFFIYDDGDHQTEMTSLGLFSQFPFLEGADIFIPTVNAQSIRCTFNGRDIFVRNWKSNSEGVNIAVFE